MIIKETIKTNTESSGIEIIGLIKSNFKLITWKITEFTNAWIRYIPNILFETLTIIFLFLSEKETFEKSLKIKKNAIATKQAVNPLWGINDSINSPLYLVKNIFITGHKISKAIPITISKILHDFFMS